MRVVLDTNVLSSVFVFPGGPPEAIYRRVLSGELTLGSWRQIPIMDPGTRVGELS